MTKLDKFHLQIISKYINHYEFKNLLDCYEKLNQLYFSTFNIINIPYNYIMLNKQIENIINNIIIRLPNVNEIILNFYNEQNNYICNNDFIEFVLCNYNKFDEYLIKHNLNKRIKIKLKLNFNIMFYISEEYNDYIFEVYLIYMMLQKNIIINQLSIIFDRTIKIKINDIYNIVNKYIFSKLRFISRINYIEWNELNEKYKNINGFLYSFGFGGKFCFNNDESYLNNIYIQHYINKYYSRYLYLHDINKFPYIYQLLKIKYNHSKLFIYRLNEYDDEMLNTIINYKSRNIDNLIYETYSIDNFKYSFDDKTQNYIMKFNKYYNGCIELNDIKLYKNINKDFEIGFSFKSITKLAEYWYNIVQNDVKNYFKINSFNI